MFLEKRISVAVQNRWKDSHGLRLSVFFGKHSIIKKIHGKNIVSVWPVRGRSKQFDGIVRPAWVYGWFNQLFWVIKTLSGLYTIGQPRFFVSFYSHCAAIRTSAGSAILVHPDPGYRYF